MLTYGYRPQWWYGRYYIGKWKRPFIAYEIVSMSQQDEPGLARLSDDILRYLRTHPQAADTVDVIVQWWLPRQRYDDAVSRVQHALDELAVRGLVDKIVLMDGTVLYADRPQKSFSLQRKL